MAWQCPICSEDFTVQGVYQTTKIAGFIADNGKDIIVAFRGTATDEATLAALNWVKTPYPPNANVNIIGQLFDCDHCVHQGLLGEYEGVMALGMRAMFETTVARLPDANIFMTGHSAGGAVANLMAYDIAAGWTPEKRLRLNVYTFGAPRIFTEGMKFEYNTFVKNTFRFVYKNDPVPCLPPISFGYSHVGIFVDCTETDMVYCQCKGLADGGGTMLSHHTFKDHTHMFSTNLDFYERDSVTLGCDGRKPANKAEKNQGDLSPYIVKKLERPQ
jgi:hypothetical protein